MAVYFWNSKKQQEETSKLLNTIEVKNEVVTQAKENERIVQVKTLKEQYPDVVGWLEINGTNINYPVMQGTDNSYYMTHDYKKEYLSSSLSFFSSRKMSKNAMKKVFGSIAKTEVLCFNIYTQ